MTLVAKPSGSLHQPPSTLPLKALPIAPARCEIGAGVLAKLGAIVAGYGPGTLIVSGPHTWVAVGARIEALLTAANVAYEVHLYDPDCTEASAAQAIARLGHGAHSVTGVGGGKALDLAKLSAHLGQRPCITVPTSAATCAAWTALGNFYQPTGGFDHGLSLPVAPAVILVDFDLVAEAPPRLLASGLADTLAKWIESSASVAYADADMTTRAALTMARLLYDEILSWGETALADARAGRLTPTVARAIEANICLAGTVGGLGGERCRSVAAHAVCNALTLMPGNSASWHGEKVAFGILVQLLLLDNMAEAQRLARFFAAIGVPITLAGLGYHLDDSQLLQVATHVCRPASTVHHLPFSVTPERVQAALVAADALGALVLA